MLRSIYLGILGRSRTSNRRKAACRARPRRLAIESLETRKLLAATPLTVNGIGDGSFEAPALAANTYQIAPPSSPWQFTGISGVSANASGFTVGNPNTADGSQVAFLKDNATITQAVYLQAGVYNLSFLAAQRADWQTQNQEIEVLVDGVEAGLIVPASTSYTANQTSNFTVTTGTHNVEFVGMSPATSDSTAFIDLASIAPVVDSLIDGGFEQPALPVNTVQADPSGAPWQFAGTAGVASNGNSTEAQNAPAGTQVGYIQQTGSIGQTVSLDTGTYQLSFDAAQSTTSQSNYQEIEVLIDGTAYGTIQPAGTQYAAYQSTPFAVTAGAHTIELLGVDPLGGANSTAFLDQVSIAPANTIGDAGFETPALNAGTYEFAPTGSSWQFSGGGGIATNASDYTSTNPTAPDGTQVAILEGNGSISQSVNLLAGSYNVSFQAAQCATNAVVQGQQIEVLVDGSQVGLITPQGTSYGLYYTSNFSVAAGPHTIEFLGTNPQGGNNTALIDLVSLTASKDQIIVGGFEAPQLAASTYQVAPSGSPWQFYGLAGISQNGSNLTTGSAAAPQGSQVGFLMDNSTMSYSVYLDTDSYSLSFLAAQRAGKYQTQAQTIEVLVDGSAVGWIAPSGTTFTAYQTSNFTVAAGMHTIQFTGISPATADSTALIDSVSIAAAENSFSNGNFAAPVLAANTYAITPAGAGWQFTGIAGVSTGVSGFTKPNKGTLNSPAGSQVAFIKDNGSMSETVYFDAGTYNISFLATQRVDYQTQNQQIEVLVGGVEVGLITPSLSTTPNSNPSSPTYTYTMYQTSNFTVLAGATTVEFLGMSPGSGDSTAFLDNMTINAGCAIGDGSFEQPALAANTYQVAPGGTAWQYAGLSGVTANASGFTSGSPNAPDGVQVAFLKDTGTIGQTVDMASGTYNLSFMAAQRKNYQSSYESLEILVDGSIVGTATPSSTSYGLYQTTNFTVTAGMHTIEFLGVNPSGGDNTDFIDEVQLNG